MKTPSPLIFDWHGHDRSLLRLILAGAITLTAMVGMFIVFRVVTPETRQVDVRPQRVLVLNPNVPAELALIHQAMDKSFGLLPTEPTVAVSSKALRMPGFVPAFTKYDLKLKPLPSGPAASIQSRPFALDMDILPPPPPAEKLPVKPAAPQVLKSVVEGDVATRAPQDLSVPNVPLADSTRPRFQVAIGRLGQVVAALPLSVSEDAVITQKLHHVVTQMRFAPADKDMAWGQVSFRWEKGDQAP